MSEEERGEPLHPSSQSQTSPALQRVVLTEAQRGALTPADWAQKWVSMDAYVDHLEERMAAIEVDLNNAKTTEERQKQLLTESQQREKILIRRIATKDQEVQDYMNQVAELKAAQAPGPAALRSALLDPAVNLLLHRLRQEVTSLKKKLEETQNELSAWKFTPDSNTGKRLMAKCRLLYQENEELGRVVSSGRLAKLEGDLALQKSFSEEVKKSQSDLDEFLQDLDEDVEGMQSTIYFLQQELKKTKEALAELQQEKTSVKSTPGDDVSPVTTADTSETGPSKNVTDLCRTSNSPSKGVTDVCRTNNSDFRTGNQSDRLTNGNHSVVCGRTTVRETAPPDTSKDSSCESSEAGDLCEDIDKEVNSHRRERKRTFRGDKEGVKSGDESNESEGTPLAKKGRRGSELSLDYNEDELCLTNGETKPEQR